MLREIDALAPATTVCENDCIMFANMDAIAFSSSFGGSADEVDEEVAEGGEGADGMEGAEEESVASYRRRLSG